MACNCNTASKKCDPCAFCTPPGVTGLTTCQPVDPCPEKVDITCVEYSGIDFPCLGVTNGEELIDVLLSILEELAPGCIPTTTTTSTSTTTTTTTIPPCYCYIWEFTEDTRVSGRVEWIDCNGDPQTIIVPYPQLGVSGSLCAQENSVNISGNYDLSGGVVECSTDEDCATTTTTTAGPACSFYEVTNTDENENSTIEYVPCNSEIAVQLVISTIPQLICVNNLYPVTTISGSVSLIDYGPCNNPAPTTTTTTTEAPACTCSNYIVLNYSGFPLTITYTECTEGGNQLVTVTFADDTTTEVCACSDIYMSHPPHGVEILNTEVPCILPTTTTTLYPPLPCKCYTVENIETESGVVAYKIDYFDCDNVFQSVLVPEGTFVNVCALENTIVANFTDITTDNGPCAPESICSSVCNCLYFIYDVIEGLDQTITYTDCDGMFVEETIKNGEILNFCGSDPIAPEFITIIETSVVCGDEGENCEECSCHQVYNSDEVPVSFTYLQCNEAGIQYTSVIINPEETLNICAIPGTIQGIEAANLLTPCLYPSQCLPV